MAARVPPPLRSIELFSGSGGLAIGTHLAGFRHAALVEWNPFACSTLHQNIAAEALPGIGDWRVVQSDARAVDFDQFGPIDLVAGGPPCQPFSLAGKHGGMRDPRDTFPEFIRAIRCLRPRAFIAENVRGLLRPSFAKYFAYLTLQLSLPCLERCRGEPWRSHAARLKLASLDADAADRYAVTATLLNAADYGVPQVRRRLVIVGIRGDLGRQWIPPRATHSHMALLQDQGQGGAYWERHGLTAPSVDSQVASAQPLLCPAGEPGDGCAPLPWRTVRDALMGPPPLPEPTLEEAPGFSNHQVRPGARVYDGHTGSVLDFPAKTLKAGVHGVPGGENMLVAPDGLARYFTLREAARLQMFPDSWTFQGPWTQAMRQLGNAVPVELARQVAHSVATIITPRGRSSQPLTGGTRTRDIEKRLSDGTVIRCPGR